MKRSADNDANYFIEPIRGFEVFEFDLPGALLVQLTAKLDSMDSNVLSLDTAQRIPDKAQGVYQLLYDDVLVYIGKTDAEAGLGKRLYRHAKKVIHRLNLDPAGVRFKAVKISVFAAMDLETQLIKHYTRYKTNRSKTSAASPAQRAS